MVPAGGNQPELPIRIELVVFLSARDVNVENVVAPPSFGSGASSAGARVAAINLRFALNSCHKG